MAVTLYPTQANAQTALRLFLVELLPAGTEVVASQVNRVPEPRPSNFVVMTPIRRERLKTNVDSYDDSYFIGYITGNVLTVTEVVVGSVILGNQMYSPGIPENVIVVAYGTGSGGVGTYTINKTIEGTVLTNTAGYLLAAGNQVIAIDPPFSLTSFAGVNSMMQATKVTYQLDVHGPAGADNAQIISTAFRDAFAVERFAALGVQVTPLYADDPKQVPFFNDQTQYEDRWVIEAVLQVDQAVGVPQQFADAVVVGLIDVDATYPPS